MLIQEGEAENSDGTKSPWHEMVSQQHGPGCKYKWPTHLNGLGELTTIYLKKTTLQIILAGRVNRETLLEEEAKSKEILTLEVMSERSLSHEILAQYRALEGVTSDFKWIPQDFHRKNRKG